ncbi:MAG: AAA family ATPase [Corynebacterium sp.]|nr:AAA family ATPase [Corynebacterium sp.]
MSTALGDATRTVGDLHLHPRWQERILGDLMEVFPQVQFIVTTHAPSVISSVARDSVRIIHDDAGIGATEAA